ncbi:hypothetical protein ACNKHL_05775 [Shigella flexneri]
MLPVDLVNPQQVQEFVDRAWYGSPNNQVRRHPFDGVADRGTTQAMSKAAIPTFSS